MTTSQIVHDILRDYPEARDSDEVLLLVYYANYTSLKDNDTVSFITDHFEFIRSFIRRRAYIQNTKGLYKPSEWAKRERRKKEERIVEAIREEKKNFASHIYDYAKRIIRKK